MALHALEKRGVIPNVQVFRVTEHIDLTFDVRGFPENNRDQHSSMAVHGNGLSEILRPDKKFLGVTVAKGRTGQAFLDFIPNAQGIDARGLAIFAGDEELGAAPGRGKSIGGNS